ncbi:hypothetical protein PR048_030390 [Dryococelus australis]|uniref:DDE-1 domain-containing protein n=1 Tax=Dryococelus australis TaxID=614101 RepID=A0ABQ9G8U8_9NEOP|nr:hypothetical protein PR048_030390 [Dryococelus australis]
MHGTTMRENSQLTRLQKIPGKYLQCFESKCVSHNVWISCRRSSTSLCSLSITTYVVDLVRRSSRILMLPRVNKSDGMKVLIRDNLSSHITLAVLQLCKQNGISFVCLLSNSTHLTQPLDVASFRPMKCGFAKATFSETFEIADGGNIHQCSRKLAIWLPEMCNSSLERERKGSSSFSSRKMNFFLVKYRVVDHIQLS